MCIKKSFNAKTGFELISFKSESVGLTTTTTTLPKNHDSLTCNFLAGKFCLTVTPYNAALILIVANTQVSFDTKW